jgi:hypothetical protein
MAKLLPHIRTLIMPSLHADSRLEARGITIQLS